VGDTGSVGDGDGSGGEGDGDGSEGVGVGLGSLGDGEGLGGSGAEGSGAGVGEADAPSPEPVTGPDAEPVPVAPTRPPSGSSAPDDTRGGVVDDVEPWAVTVDPEADVRAPSTASEDWVPAGRRARDSGRSGSDGAAARVAIGASWESGSFRRRSTSDAVSTRTGASATTSRTADTAARPTAAAPAAIAAHAVIDSQRCPMRPVCPLVRLIPH
jgi:hypothetical protein